MRRFVIVLLAVSLWSIPVRAAATCYDWNGYHSCLPNADTFFRIPPPVTSGWAVYYEPGVMEGTAEYRGFMPDGRYIGEEAAMTPAMIGWSVWLKRLGKDWEGPFLVVDCPRRNDQYGLIVYKHEVVEVDFDTAVRWGFVKVTGLDANAHYTYKVVVGGESDVQVSYYPPSKINQSAVVYRDWYRSIFVAGIKNEYIVEDIPDHPELWCITREQSCEGRWQIFRQPP